MNNIKATRKVRHIMKKRIISLLENLKRKLRHRSRCVYFKILNKSFRKPFVCFNSREKFVKRDVIKEK